MRIKNTEPPNSIPSSEIKEMCFTHHQLTHLNLWFDLELMLMVYVQTEMSIQDTVMLSSDHCSTSMPPYLPEERTT